MNREQLDNYRGALGLCVTALQNAMEAANHNDEATAKMFMQRAIDRLYEAGVIIFGPAPFYLTKP